MNKSLGIGIALIAAGSLIGVYFLKDKFNK